MAGKKARGNEKRKARFKSHPNILPVNKTRRRNTHVTALRKKLRKFARYVEAKRMSEASFAIIKERIEKEIKYTLGELKRPVPEYKKGKKKKNEE